MRVQRAFVSFAALSLSAAGFLPSLAGAQEPHAAELSVKSAQLPADVSTVTLEAAAQISFEPLNESSGLVRSRQRPDVFWTHNDSGDAPRMFAIRRDGSIILPEWINDEKDFAGIQIEAAAAVDWEDIALDDDGNLYIADTGNNANSRRDLGVYVVREPDPEHTAVARAVEWLEFRYPDQDAFPPAQKNFDCEAIFWARGKLYFLSKHRADANTKLYRMDAAEPFVRNPLTLLDSFEIGGMVTAADATTDGQRLAVLTYNNVWVFDAPEGTDRYFDGAIRWLPIFGNQIESLCFADRDTLLIGNEQRQIFELPVDRLRLVRPASAEASAAPAGNDAPASVSATGEPGDS